MLQPQAGGGLDQRLVGCGEHQLLPAGDRQVKGIAAA